MKSLVKLIISCIFIASTTSIAGEVNFNTAPLTAVNVSYSVEKMKDITVVKAVKNPEVNAVDEPTFVRLSGEDFKDGTIEVKVLSRLLPDAPDYARGFIGIAFRINKDNSLFESIYIRPTNGRIDDAKRRQHATQYFAYPDFKFDRLRKESPGKYESPADIGLDEWIQLKIVVNGSNAKLFINNAATPVLTVEDLKLPANSSGAIGLWTDIGTEAYFSDLLIKGAYLDQEQAFTILFQVQTKMVSKQPSKILK
jgi:hypothetical protein